MSELDTAPSIAKQFICVSLFHCSNLHHLEGSTGAWVPIRAYKSKLCKSRIKSEVLKSSGISKLASCPLVFKLKFGIDCSFFFRSRNNFRSSSRDSPCNFSLGVK